MGDCSMEQATMAVRGMTLCRSAATGGTGIGGRDAAKLDKTATAGPVLIPCASSAQRKAPHQ